MTYQSWNAHRYAERAAYVAELGGPVVELLAPKPGERVLDLGCGDGTLTEAIGNLTGSVVGVDASDAMVTAARARGVEAHVMSGEALRFESEFDAVFSNAALHWMRDPRAVIAGVRRALVPGGRFVGEFGGAGNIARIVEAMEHGLSAVASTPRFENPWFFPRADEYRALLKAAGFTVMYIELFERPTPLEHGVRGWIEVFQGALLDRMSGEDRAAFLATCEEYLRPHLFTAEGGWWADYVRLRFAATV